MPNPAPKIENLTPFDSERARKAAARSAEKRSAGEPLKPVSVKIYARQHAEMVRRGENLSDVIRRLLDEHLNA